MAIRWCDINTDDSETLEDVRGIILYIFAMSFDKHLQLHSLYAISSYRSTIPPNSAIIIYTPSLPAPSYRNSHAAILNAPNTMSSHVAAENIIKDIYSNFNYKGWNMMDKCIRLHYFIYI